MSEISIKIKGPISRVVKTKKKAKARTGKPKTKTENYLEKLKGREFSYNTSPFYDYKAGLQPTYIYRQQTIPQLQQDNKHTDLIKYLENMKKSDRESQTGKFRNTGPPPIPYFPDLYSVDEPNEDEQKTSSGVILEDITKQEEHKKLLKLIKQINNTNVKISLAKSKYEKAKEAENIDPDYTLDDDEPLSSKYQKNIDALKKAREAFKTEKKALEINLGI